MAIFFNKLPREIRDMIYELLLVKHNPEVEFRAIKKGYCRIYDDHFPKINLHPAILRTCQQAYAEGLPMLYERNVFTYLKLVHFQADWDSDVDTPLTTIRFLAAAGCSLSTLDLAFTFYSDHHTTYNSQPYNEDLLEEIATLSVESKISIRAKAYDDKYTTRFDYVANYLGLIKQWAIAEDLSVAEPWDTLTLYTREWVLRPSNASTIHKVPSSERVGEIYWRRIDL